jgi:alpha-amylase
VHQPFRLKNYSLFDIGNNADYFNEKKNMEIMQKVANKCYLPTNKIMLDLINKHNGRFKISYSISGVALEQFEKYAPEVLDSFMELNDTGCVEFLNETYYHSLSFLYSKEEFKEQIIMHKKKIRSLFNQKPKVFRNTELIFNNELANFIQRIGYKGILAEGADHILGWRSPNFIYTAKTAPRLKMLLKNYKLSDDIAFRFSNRSWKEWPLTVEKYAGWLNAANGNGNLVNLFMDYETFGEHQWEDTGIFDFLRHFPGEILKHSDNNFMTPTEAIKNYNPVSELDVHCPVSWADIERDTSAWDGNKMQQSAIQRIYLVEGMIKRSKNKELIENWRKLQTSDHFYYMCTKWFNDGDVHKYFNPYENPYDAFIAFMNILNDINLRLDDKNTIKKEVVL